MTTPLKPNIRLMTRRDLPAVLEIENASFGFPWSRDDFLTCLRNRSCYGIVADLGRGLSGFAIYELAPKEIKLLNFAVWPNARRRRVGLQLVDAITSKLTTARPDLTLMLGERNLPGQLFFRACGFLAVEVLREQFGEDDGYAMVYSTAKEPPAFRFGKKRVKRSVPVFGG